MAELSTRDADQIRQIDAAFAAVERPEHFTDFTHCCECSEHDELLRSRDRDSLQLADVGNAGWDPLCFCSAQGIAYWLPALVRFALRAEDSTQDWYGDQLVFHLSYGGAENRLLQWCNDQQRLAIARLIGHLIETRSATIDRYGLSERFCDCHGLWSQG